MTWQVRVKMIDFAKTFPVTDANRPAEGECADLGYVEGLRTIVKALETLSEAKYALWGNTEEE